MATSQASASHPPKPSFAFLATVGASPGEALARPGSVGAAAVVVSGAAMSDPWVADGVEEVDEEVDEPVDHGDESHPALTAHVPALSDHPLDQHPPAGYGEDHNDPTGAADERANLKSEE